ncbi:MAG: hypothetical protein K0B16_16025 [Burkholderiaceae bacterium]|nr:hypothetical protein [Burkholderiaceae bacterium]
MILGKNDIWGTDMVLSPAALKEQLCIAIDHDEREGLLMRTCDGSLDVGAAHTENQSLSSWKCIAGANRLHGLPSPCERLIHANFIYQS